MKYILDQWCIVASALLFVVLPLIIWHEELNR